MHIVTYMDEITLWGFSQVNSRWKNIILKCVSNDRWRYYLLHRFVFYRPTYKVSNWFEVTHPSLTANRPTSNCQLPSGILPTDEQLLLFAMREDDGSAGGAGDRGEPVA